MHNMCNRGTRVQVKSIYVHSYVVWYTFPRKIVKIAVVLFGLSEKETIMSILGPSVGSRVHITY